MGSGRHLVISATGFPGTNETWRFIQMAWREPLNALALLAGNKTILTGIVVTNDGGIYTASSGFVSYNGEILPFQSGEVQSSVTLVEETVSVVYDVDIDADGASDTLPGYKTRYLKFGSDGIESFPFIDLTALKTVKELSLFELPAGIVIDADYVHTDCNFTLALLTKLNGIEAGAQVNVQADWNSVNPSSDSYILNKPTNLLRALKRGTVIIGNVQDNSNDLITVNFPSIGTNSYFVLGSLTGYNSEDDHSLDNDVTMVVRGPRTDTYFKLSLDEYESHVQNLRFDYVLIPSF